MDLGAWARRDPRVPHPRDVRLEEFASWGNDCGDMFFYPEGALNILYSPTDRNFSVKIKYMGFAPDGYCKRINACSRAGACAPAVARGVVGVWSSLEGRRQS